MPSPATAAIEPEVDLVNDPDPPPERIEQVLGRYPFEDVSTAYENLMALATEKIRFLSHPPLPPLPRRDRAAARWPPSPPRPSPTRRWSTSAA